MSISFDQSFGTKRLKKAFILYSLLLLVTIASRCLVLGNPFIFGDEEFYLFVGGRMLHGDLPYVDIWDRKPIGTFLIYEFFHLFGAYRLWAYQIGALLCAWLTAISCVKIARFIAPVSGAFCAGCLYLLWVAGCQGSGGQNPIFYNLLVAWAVLLITRYITSQTKPPLTRIGIKVMLLLGLALQIKTSVIFEGIYLGCVLLWLSYRQNDSLPRISCNAVIWCLVALLPTLSVMAYYALAGHFHEWWFANIASIFLKEGRPAFSLHEIWHNAHWLFIILAILLVITLLRIAYREPALRSPSSLFLGGWAWTAFLGFALFGSFSKHYSLPLFAPFFINTAPLFRRHIGQVWIALLLVWGGSRAFSSEEKIRHNSPPEVLKEITSVLSSPPGCVFNFTGSDAILNNVQYCPLTRFPFSAHLSSEMEKHALGIDPTQEVKRILAGDPLYIILSADDQNGEGPTLNKEAYHFVKEKIKKEYKEVYMFPKRDPFDGVEIYKKNN